MEIPDMILRRLGFHLGYPMVHHIDMLLCFRYLV